MSKPFMECSDQCRVIDRSNITKEDYEMIFGEAAEREQRLQELREEFEAVRDEWLAKQHVMKGTDISSGEEVFHEVTVTNCELNSGCRDLVTVEDWACSDNALMLVPAPTVMNAARRYIIARDFSEFDPKRALMLWKLQRQ